MSATNNKILAQSACISLSSADSSNIIGNTLNTSNGDGIYSDSGSNSNFSFNIISSSNNNIYLHY